MCREDLLLNTNNILLKPFNLLGLVRLMVIIVDVVVSGMGRKTN
jgi:hypothetical protein